MHLWTLVLLRLHRTVWNLRRSPTSSLAPPFYLSVLTPPQKHDCRPTNFITTALNCTVLEPSNYSSLRCGHVEKGRKSTEVGAPGLKLWENWKQIICPFPYPFLLFPSFCLSNTLPHCPPPPTSRGAGRLKKEDVWSLWCGGLRGCPVSTLSIHCVSISPDVDIY